MLCMVLVIGSFSACKKTGDTGDTTESKPETTTTEVTEATTTPTDEKKLVEIDYSQPIEFSYWLMAYPNDYYSSYSDNPVVKYLNKKFNMELSFEQPAAGTERDALNMMMGTGEYTDLIDTTMYTGSIAKLYDDGVIINIADYLDYMPNYKKLLDENETFRKNTYNDEGRILKLTSMDTENETMWSGLVYRRDILENVTGGNIAFPSGNDSPTTIEDWDYMLPLFKQYFESQGLSDYAPFILSSYGYIPSNDLLNSYGAGYSYFADNGTIKYGPTEDGYYSYLLKMHEWYESGYIYKDFASRTNDMFFMPNTALTYGGTAGIWFGMPSQLGAAMSADFDVQPMLAPIDSEHGITSAPQVLHNGAQDSTTGVCVSSACKDIERLLSTIDYLYSEEGSLLRAYGLDQAHGSAENEIYVKNELADGTYSLTDGTFKLSDQFAVLGGPLNDYKPFAGLRLMGLRDTSYIKQYAPEAQKEANDIWLAYQEDTVKMPAGLSRTIEEDDTYTETQANLDDYINSMILKFILGSEELNETSWAEFKAQLESYGVEDNIVIQQAAYDRYMAR